MTMRSFLRTADFGESNDHFSITLGVYESNERLTSEHIAEMLLKTCTEWSNKVSFVVTDNAANMVKDVDLTLRKNISMFCIL